MATQKTNKDLTLFRAGRSLIRQDQRKNSVFCQQLRSCFLSVPWILKTQDTKSQLLESKQFSMAQQPKFWRKIQPRKVKSILRETLIVSTTWRLALINPVQETLSLITITVLVHLLAVMKNRNGTLSITLIKQKLTTRTNLFQTALTPSQTTATTEEAEEEEEAISGEDIMMIMTKKIQKYTLIDTWQAAILQREAAAEEASTSSALILIQSWRVIAFLWTNNWASQSKS